MSQAFYAISPILPQDHEIHEAALQFLMTADLNSLTLKTLKAALEGRFGILLDVKKELIKNTLLKFIENYVYKPQHSVQLDEEVDPTLKKRTPGGLAAPVQLSPELSQFMGALFASRTEVVKKVWSYIRENSCQNPNDKREIVCDERLESLFGRKNFTMFKMNTFLAPMMKSITDLNEGEPKPKVKRVKAKRIPGEKVRKETKGHIGDDGKVKRALKAAKPSIKRQGVGAIGGLSKPLLLSDELSGLLGVRQDSRCQVVARLWAHIKRNNLQNPNDKREIILDIPMQNVFKVDKLTMFSINKALVPHLRAIP